MAVENVVTVAESDEAAKNEEFTSNGSSTAATVAEIVTNRLDVSAIRKQIRGMRQTTR